MYAPVRFGINFFYNGRNIDCSLECLLLVIYRGEKDNSFLIKHNNENNNTFS